MEIRNTIEQEENTRHTDLFLELMATMAKRAEPYRGYQWIEVIDKTEVRLHSRYVVQGATYQITQRMVLDAGSEMIHETPSPSTPAATLRRFKQKTDETARTGHSPDDYDPVALQ